MVAGLTSFESGFEPDFKDLVGFGFNMHLEKFFGQNQGI